MKLPLDAKIKLISSVVNDYISYITTKKSIPKNMEYKITSLDEDRLIKHAARVSALENLKPTPMVKLAFDTRRVDQEKMRNPRSNLQYWHRSDEFIDEEDGDKLQKLAKLYNVVKGIKKKFGKSPEWFESYARQLYNNLNRILRVKEGDFDIFKPQLSYLEQLIFARYRLSMDDLETYSDQKIEKCVLSKDEKLIGRNDYLKTINSYNEEDDDKVVKNSLDLSTQESVVNALFDSKNLRKEGEKQVQRTIQITITDSVLD